MTSPIHMDCNVLGRGELPPTGQHTCVDNVPGFVLSGQSKAFLWKNKLLTSRYKNITMQRISFFFFLIILLACRNEMPADFSFKITSATSSYNSVDGKYTRKGVTKTLADTSITDLLSRSELEVIYNYMTANSISSIPSEFICDTTVNYTYIQPSSESKLEYRMNGKYRFISYESGCTPKTDRLSEINFNKIDSMILATLLSRPKIKMLPNSRILFL